jgi:hypothetical protein
MHSDLDGETVHAIAMMSLLETDIQELKTQFRPTRAGSTQKLRRLKDMPVPDKLSILSLRLSDKALENALSVATKAQPPSQSGRKSPVRHAVRGHLFLASNKKMIYRKPHWRGVEREHINRII